jgi:SAM-dependent methyltransferase
VAAARGVSVRAERGDARAIARPDGYADAVVLLGPLYHLVGRDDRLRCLQEARRVLRPGGVLVAAAISRFSRCSTVSGASSSTTAGGRRCAERCGGGAHLNPGRTPGLFTTAYFHLPDELQGELVDAGFVDVGVLAVEGPTRLLDDLDLNERAAAPKRWATEAHGGAAPPGGRTLDAGDDRTSAGRRHPRPGMNRTNAVPEPGTDR